MGYTRQEIIDKCKLAVSDISSFYKADFINYRGKTSDTKEYYTEVVSEYVCDNIYLLDSIRQIKRETSYKTLGHDGNYSASSNRLEEVTAMQMFKQCKEGTEYDYIGQIIDYQTPLKNQKKDDAGKIDLLSVRENKVFILELKKEDSTETMLRCVLEGYTYLKTVCAEKLISDFKLSGIQEICAAPLVFKGMSQWKEMQEKRPHISKLIKITGCKPYYIHKNNDKFIITED